MGDRKPSQFLRHLCRLALDVPDSLLRSLWTSRSPTNVQATLVCHPDASLDSAAEYADRIIETAPQPTLSLSADNSRRSSYGERRSTSEYVGGGIDVRYPPPQQHFVAYQKIEIVRALFSNQEGQN
jgi:hypothetical protein